ncbi:MAG TPA: hypothetical protein VFR87_05350 [Nocardioidaceae bacterium]|nr:hypothetical protein [Nocardioidaceae bacterium]
MIKTFTPSIEAGLALPSYWTVAAHAPAACTLPTMGGVTVVAGAAGTKRRIAGEGQVRPNTGTTTVFVLDGAFPGTSVWSPPI